MLSCFSGSRASANHQPPLADPLEADTPPPEGTWGKGQRPLTINMGPGSQTGSDIHHTEPPAPVDRKIPVKTLSCLKLRMQAVMRTSKI